VVTGTHLSWDKGLSRNQHNTGEKKKFLMLLTFKRKEFPCICHEGM
jgi:hypothetical protein